MTEIRGSTEYPKNIKEHIGKINNDFYNYTINFQKTDLIDFDITIYNSIDFLTFTIYSPDNSLNQLLTQLIILSVSNGDTAYNNNYTYNRVKKYRISFNNKEHDIVTMKAHGLPYMPFLIRVHDPTPELLLFLEPYLHSLDYYHINNIEFTSDFVGHDPVGILDFFRETCWVKWRGKSYRPSHGTTHYGNNIRFSTAKGLRAYIKEWKGEGSEYQFKESTRLELLLKRPILKKKGINNIQDFLKFDNQILSRYFDFRTFNFQKLMNMQYKEALSVHIVEDTAKWINQMLKLGYCNEVDKVAKKIRKLMKIPTNRKSNYDNNSFIIQHPFTDEFYYELTKVSYLKRESFRIQSAWLDPPEKTSFDYIFS